MTEGRQGSKPRMPKPGESPGWRLLGGGGYGTLLWPLIGPLGEEGHREEALCPKLPQPLWDLGRTCPGSRGPLATLTLSHSQLQLWNSLSHTCLCSWADRERPQAVGLSTPSPCSGLCGCRLSRQGPERQPADLVSLHQLSTPSLPQPTQKGGPQQACSGYLTFPHTQQ